MKQKLVKEEEEEASSITQGHLLINAHKCHSAFSIMRVPAYIEPHCFNGSPPFELVLQISAKMPSPPPAKKILENLQTLAVHRRCHHTMAGLSLDNKAINQRCRPLIHILLANSLHFL